MTEEKQVTIEVNGNELQAPAGAMLIDVTDEAGISIPRFCYHKKLSVSANCRMCLVEVENVPKPLPACATPVSDGMKVQTRSPKALAAQKGTMEFLLINHPLDCPICDQGGECELQDVAIEYGDDVSRYVECKRVVQDDDIGPLIATEMTRCIHCTRCVRFGSEIAGVRVLGATGRGEHMKIGTYVSATVDHELSGNIIDLCPVGALTSKPYRFSARPWELSEYSAVATHDSLGSNVKLHVRRNQLMRVHPGENEAINETWISDRDRFSYQGLYSDDRISAPMIRKNGEWEITSWEEALDLVSVELKKLGSELATLVSPRATLEEMYLAQKITRALGSSNIDSRLRQGAFDDEAAPLAPWLGLPVSELENLDAILVIGSNLRKEHPLLAHRIRKAARNGAKVTFVNPMAMDLTHDAEQVVSSPEGMLIHLACLLNGLGGEVAASSGAVQEAKATDDQIKWCAEFKEAGKSAVFVGNIASALPDYAVIQGIAHSIAQKSGAKIGYLPIAANTVGAALAGALPHVGPGVAALNDVGEHAADCLSKQKKSYLIVRTEPNADSWNPAAAMQSLSTAEFVVALSSWKSPFLQETADVILPVSDFGETAGTLVNAEGVWQSFQGCVAPQGETRPAWKVLRVLGNLLDLEGFDFASAGNVREELTSICKDTKPSNALRKEFAGKVSEAPNGTYYRIGDVPIHSVDGLVRRSEVLQKTADAVHFGAYLNHVDAGNLGISSGDPIVVKQDDKTATIHAYIDNRIADGCVRIPSGIEGSDQLGAAFGPVTLEKG